MQEKITVTVNEDGSTHVHVEGCPGPTCEALTRDLEVALGGEYKGPRSKTREWFLRVANAVVPGRR